MKSLKQVLEKHAPPPGAPMGPIEASPFDRAEFDADLDIFLKNVKFKNRCFGFGLFVLVLVLVLGFLAADSVQDLEAVRTAIDTKGVLVAALGLIGSLIAWIVSQLLSLSRRQGLAKLMQTLSRHASDEIVQEAIKATLTKIPEIL